MSPRLGNKRELWLGWGAFALSFSFLVWYIFRGCRYLINADSASRVLLAREIVDTGRLFPPDWVYVNGDVLAFSPHLAVLPFLYFLPGGFLVYALSTLIFSALVLYGAWLVTELLELSLARRLLVLAVLASGLSTMTAEFIFGQLTYGVVLGMCCYLLYFAYRAAASEERRTRITFLVLVFAASLVGSVANPRRGLVYYFFPLAVALLFRGYHFAFTATRSPPQVNRTLLAGALMVLGAGAGTACYRVLFSGLLNVQGAGEARWLDPPSMLRNLGLLWTQYLGIFGAAAPSGEPVMSGQGIYWAAKLCMAMLLLWLVPVACRRRMAQPLSGGAFLVVFAMALGIVTLFFQLTTSIADPSDPVGSGRYLLPPAILLLFVAMAYRLDFKSNPIQSAAVILIASSFVATAWFPLYANVVSTQNVKRRDDLIALQNYLLENDLRYGYATYWNSAPLTVISAERVRARPIISIDGLPLPAPWIASMRWYRPQEWTGPTFLLLTAEETKLFDWKSMATHGLVPARRTQLRGFEIVVFDRNLPAEVLPGWSAPLQYVRSRP